MIKAFEEAGLAGIVAHHLGRAMPADIVEAANYAIVAADQDDRLAGDPHAAEVARLIDLAFVTGELPDLDERSSPARPER